MTPEGKAVLENDARDEIRIELLNAQSNKALFDMCGQLHAEIISNGFLTSLGPAFLSTFYRSVASMPQSFLLVAIRDVKVVGLIAGSTDSKGLMKRILLTRVWRFAPRMASILLRPASLSKIFEVILYPSKQAFKNLPNAEVLNFCVSSKLQGRGLGKRLFQSLVEEFEKRKTGAIRIVTGASQQSAQYFYQSVGAVEECSTTNHDNSVSIVFVYNISASNNDTSRSTQ
jgi:ribosomal protein S18 acetylase RimI-like enzyme